LTKCVFVLVFTQINVCQADSPGSWSWKAPSHAALR